MNHIMKSEGNINTNSLKSGYSERGILDIVKPLEDLSFILLPHSRIDNSIFVLCLFNDANNGGSYLLLT